jgi:hypothetical protein
MRLGCYLPSPPTGRRCNVQAGCAIAVFKGGAPVLTVGSACVAASRAPIAASRSAAVWWPDDLVGCGCCHFVRLRLRLSAMVSRPSLAMSFGADANVDIGGGVGGRPCRTFIVCGLNRSSLHRSRIDFRVRWEFPDARTDDVVAGRGQCRRDEQPLHEDPGNPAHAPIVAQR